MSRTGCHWQATRFALRKLLWRRVGQRLHPPPSLLFCRSVTWLQADKRNLRIINQSNFFGGVGWWKEKPRPPVWQSNDPLDRKNCLPLQINDCLTAISSRWIKSDTRSDAAHILSDPLNGRDVTEKSDTFHADQSPNSSMANGSNSQLN